MARSALEQYTNLSHEEYFALEQELGEKFAAYRLIKSLQTYIMLHPDKPLAEVYQRGEDNSWLLREFSGLETVINLSNDLALSMADLYLKVKF